MEERALRNRIIGWIIAVLVFDAVLVAAIVLAVTR